MSSSSPRRRPRRSMRLRWAITLMVTTVVLSSVAVGSTAAEGLTSSAAPSGARARVLACPVLPTPITSAPLSTPPSARTVALTFDDGPGVWTRPVLDLLRKEKVVATFFVVGKEVESRREILAEMVRGGHLVGNHSWSHPIPGSAGWDAPTLTTEIQRTQDVVQRATGVRPCLFRPPYGAMPGALPVTSRLRLSVALWSVDPRDWEQRPNDGAAPDRIRRLTAAGLRQAHPVLLLHDGGGDRRATVAALPGIIADYRAQGYQFVRLDGGK